MNKMEINTKMAVLLLSFYNEYNLDGKKKIHSGNIRLLAKCA